MTEGWMYFFDYNLGLELNVEYEDHDKAAAYLESYAAELVNSGFSPVYADDEINYYESPNTFSSFRYHFDDDGALSLLFKAERYISPDEAETLLAGVGFPAIDLREPITCRDLVKNQKLTCDVDFKLFLTISQIFDTVEEAENFLNDYEAALTAAGFDRSSPEFVYSNKPVKIYNEEADMMVAIDLVEQANNVFVGFDFWAK